MIRFGTGGWRAIIGDEFTKSNIRILAAALAEKIKEESNGEQGLVVGYDRRFLSVEAAGWVCEVMAGYGIVVRLVRMEAPTPLIMYCVKYYGTRYGLIITASHNPAVYNGIKIFTEGGCDASEEVTSDLERHIERIRDQEILSMPYEKGVEAKLIMEINPQNEYVDSIIRSIDMEAIRARQLKIVLDPMYGVSKTSLQMILSTARCRLDVIHERHDALFGGRLPAPTEETLKSLANYVAENQFDLGIATDGDADRVGIIDNKGNFLHPNKILVLLYYYLLKYKKWTGPVVRNIATTHLLDRIAEMYGEVCYETPVGFKHISSRMEETGAVIGGESSGGLTVRGHIRGKDGIYASALLVEMMAVTGKELPDIYEEITHEFGEFHMEERDYRFSEKKKAQVMKRLLEDRELPEFEDEIRHVSYIDGCKVYFKNDGWIIARFSGTEPLLRVFCEMENIAEARKNCLLMEEFLRVDEA